MCFFSCSRDQGRKHKTSILLKMTENNNKLPDSLDFYGLQQGIF